MLEHVPLKRVEDTTGIVCVDLDTGAPAALCVMDNWTHTSVQVHWVIIDPMALRHGFLEECFDYVFNQAERDLMIGLVPSDNAKSLKLAKHADFTELYRVQDAIKFGVDTVIIALRKRDCSRLRAPVQLAS